MRSAIVGVCVFLCSLANANGAREELEGFSSALTTLSGKFSQTLMDSNGKVKEQSQGALALMAPRQFRWDVLQPFEQHIVADGNAIWVYDVELEQVNVRAQSFDEANSPLAVLLDLSSLDREFNVGERATSDGQKWLRLTAKSKNPDFKYADLGFANKQLKTMILVDNFGQRSRIDFSAWQRNPKLPASQFQFEVPDGVDVVGAPPEAAKIQTIPD